MTGSAIRVRGWLARFGEILGPQNLPGGAYATLSQVPLAVDAAAIDGDSAVARGETELHALRALWAVKLDRHNGSIARLNRTAASMPAPTIREIPLRPGGIASKT